MFENGALCDTLNLQVRTNGMNAVNNKYFFLETLKKEYFSHYEKSLKYL